MFSFYFGMKFWFISSLLHVYEGDFRDFSNIIRIIAEKDKKIKAILNPNWTIKYGLITDPIPNPYKKILFL